jgi:hypothetical protein
MASEAYLQTEPLAPLIVQGITFASIVSVTLAIVIVIVWVWEQWPWMVMSVHVVS